MSPEPSLGSNKNFSLFEGLRINEKLNFPIKPDTLQYYMTNKIKKTYFKNDLSPSSLELLISAMPSSNTNRHNLLSNYLSKYKINTMYNPDVNIINGDLLQLFKNYRILTNREILKSNNPMFKLYGDLDLGFDKICSHTYSENVIKALDPDKLNIIEGGSAFYLYYLKTRMLKEFEDVRTIFMYFDSRIIGNRLTQRVEKMFIEGGLEEFVSAKQALDK